MSKNFYDKECKHPIKCFYDPCYRTGDYYKICYLNRGFILDEYNILESNENSVTFTHNGYKNSYEYSDTLYAIVSRSEGKPIYFINSLGKELVLKPIKIEKYIASNEHLIHFVEVNTNMKLIYDEYGYLVELSDMDEYVNYGHCLISYSFVSNYMEKDNIINPHNYQNVEPLTVEEKEIVYKRMYEDPYYKINEYK
jgi:hypothetical protein